MGRMIGTLFSVGSYFRCFFLFSETILSKVPSRSLLNRTVSRLGPAARTSRLFFFSAISHSSRDRRGCSERSFSPFYRYRDDFWSFSIPPRDAQGLRRRQK